MTGDSVESRHSLCLPVTKGRQGRLRAPCTAGLESQLGSATVAQTDCTKSSTSCSKCPAHIHTRSGRFPSAADTQPILPSFVTKAVDLKSNRITFT